MKKKITVNHEGSFLVGRKGVKIPYEVKLKYARLCYEGKMNYAEAGRQLGLELSSQVQQFRIIDRVYETFSVNMK
ncbi:MAG: hypothetical protein IJH75_00450 [Mogibacterium sp.]|nr:hypothetical protein [Mogibacterium sp.]